MVTASGPRFNAMLANCGRTQAREFGLPPPVLSISGTHHRSGAAARDPSLGLLVQEGASATTVWPSGWQRAGFLPSPGGIPNNTLSGNFMRPLRYMEDCRRS